MSVETVMQVVGWASLLVGLMVTIRQTAKSSQSDQVALERQLKTPMSQQSDLITPSQFPISLHYFFPTKEVVTNIFQQEELNAQT